MISETTSSAAEEAQLDARFSARVFASCSLGGESNECLNHCTAHERLANSSMCILTYSCSVCICESFHVAQVSHSLVAQLIHSNNMVLLLVKLDNRT